MLFYILKPSFLKLLIPRMKKFNVLATTATTKENRGNCIVERQQEYDIIGSY